MSTRRLVRATIIAFPLLATSAAAQMRWVAQAPGPNTDGQVEQITEGEVVGAINAIAVHPTNENIVYVGAVNGGVWRTDSAMAAAPSWRPLTDGQASNSIGAIEIDPTDATSNTVVVGTGRFSSFRGQGGERVGLLRTVDGGQTWSTLNGGGRLAGLNIVAVTPRGSTIVLAANSADGASNSGIWRSIDTGIKWDQLTAAAGLPAAPATDLIGDPSDRARLVALIRGQGVYLSTNTGASWKKISNPEIDATFQFSDNAKGSIGASKTLYVGIVRSGQLAVVFRLPGSGTSWTKMDLPATSEGGVHIGRQGGIHFSIAADPANANLVYVGGDRQPSRVVNGREDFTFPNSIGANDYSGRLFRGDASKPSGGQWAHLTHSRTLGAPGGGTALGSAPHADSRDLSFARNGVLLEADDGGVYRRTNPATNSGDWFSMNGNLQATEFHSVAWDSNVHLIIGGAQDTGTPQQRLRSNVKWQTVSRGDGGVVAVDDTSSTAVSTRYSSYQYLGNLRRDTYNAQNVLEHRVVLPLRVVGGGNPPEPQFYTPLRLNSVTTTRLIIGAANAVYESNDEGDTIEEIGTGIVANDTGPQSIAYGAAGNPDVLYVGARNRVFIRTGAPPAALQRSDQYPGGRVVGIALNPANGSIAHVLNEQSVFRTTDAGQAWTNLTGNLAQLRPGALRSIAYVTDAPGSIIVGSDRGVFEARGPSFNSWSGLGTGLPAVPVYHLEYDGIDRLLLAGTLGRGAWTLSFGPSNVNTTNENLVTGPLPAAAPPPPPTQPDAAADAVELGPGVVVHPARNAVYLMTPGGATEAVDFVSGKQLWQTRVVAKPLAVAGGRLVGQTEDGPDNVLRMRVLDSATGQPVAAGERPLPAGVVASVNETSEGAFVASAQVQGGEPIIKWQYQERRRQGIPPGTEAAVTGGGGVPLPASAGQQITRSGAFRIDLTTGATGEADAPGPMPAAVSRVNPLSSTTRVESLPIPQFLSADGRHVLVSERVGDASVWQKYRLTVYERGTLRRVGAMNSHLSQVAFIVQGSTVLFETGPYSQRTGDQVIDEPLKIRSVDLETGKELWNRPVRETVSRTPPPA